MKNGTSHIHSFFVEIILVLLFFSLSAAVTLRVFAAAGQRAQQSSELSVAVVRAEDIAEQLSGLSSPGALPKTLVSAQKTETGGTAHYRLFFDRKWVETTDDPRYVLDVALKQTPAAGGTRVDAAISVLRRNSGGESPVYTLNSAKYFPGAV